MVYVDGLCFMVCDFWRMVYSVWFTVHGSRFIGLCFMVQGLEFRV
jgi:hypothetical protein